MASQEVVDRWTKDAKKALVGRRIVGVRYLTEEELASLDWRCASVVLELDNGAVLYPSADDEGNGPGALFTTFKHLPVVPVI